MFFVISKIPCVEFGRDPTRKNSKIKQFLLIHMKWAKLNSKIVWSGRNRAAEFFFVLYQKFIVLNLEGIPLKNFSDFENFY